ncbi:MAG TPA: 2-oxo acid dehydrogenase subunit E2 [Vicinamibacterales bacterium]|nr:2-oxo acid dehydrogenase subunit E2 [Vicinamibacterales bacterium]
MPTEFKLPELGENVTAGDVMRVLVKPGDTVANEQAVLELETDKATIEVPSSVAGTVKDVKVKQGEKVKVGQTIFTVDDADADAGAGASAPAAKNGDKAKPQPAGAPEEGGLSQAATPDRDAPTSGGRAGSAREDREGDKPGIADQQPRAQHPAPRMPEDEIEDAPRQKRGEVVDISRAPRAQAGAAPAAEGPAPAAGPSVRRIARELGVDIRQVTGSGPAGRITVDDVQTFVRDALSSGGAGGAQAPASAPSAQPLPDFSKWGDVERKPISNVRRKTAEHLGHAWNVIPAVTQHDKADITALEELRRKYSPMAERAGGKLTVTSVALKILAAAIRKYPQFTASLDMARGQLIYKKFSNIGVAVDTDRGLLVAVIRDVESKGIIELSAELAKVSEKARAGKLTLDEMSGGVITISNLGGIGGVGFSPIVNWPEVAILGISRGSYEPVWDGTAFQPRLMLPLSLSYDHRVIDGADAARFLRWVAEAFGQPFVLAL